jgi:hypothetical protein
VTREAGLYRPVWVALAGCQAPPDGAAWVAPFDGATSVPVDARLHVATGPLDLPRSYPIDPATVSAVVLPDATAVPGVIRVGADSDLLTFTPTEGFAPVRTYRWSVVEPDPVVREIHADLPDGILGDRSFTTSPASHLLDAVVDAGTLCLLFSAPYTSTDLVIGLAGAPPRLVSFSRVEPLQDVVIEDDLPDPGGLCPDDSLGAEPGDPLTYVAASGVRDEVEVTEGTLQDALLARHRWTPP